MKYSLIFLYFLLLSCASNDADSTITKFIQGNWYYINSFNQEYQEFFFDEKYAYRFIVSSASVLKSEYEIRKGKLYFCHEYVGDKRICDDSFGRIYFRDSSTINVGFFISPKKLIRFEPEYGIEAYINKEMSVDSLYQYGDFRLNLMIDRSNIKAIDINE